MYLWLQLLRCTCSELYAGLYVSGSIVYVVCPYAYAAGPPRVFLLCSGTVTYRYCFLTKKQHKERMGIFLVVCYAS